MKYFWKFNDAEWQELPLRKRTNKFYIFEYPGASPRAGEPWRMSETTVERYISIGVILEVPTEMRIMSQQQYRALGELPEAIDDLLAEVATTPLSPAWKRLDELLTLWESYDVRLFGEMAPAVRGLA